MPCIRVCLDILEHTDTPQERLLPSTLQISNNGLIADLQDRAILCKLSLVHASGKFFVGSIRNAGFDLIPPFAVDSILMLWAWRKELAFFWNLV